MDDGERAAAPPVLIVGTSMKDGKFTVKIPSDGTVGDLKQAFDKAIVDRRRKESAAAGAEGCDAVQKPCLKIAYKGVFVDDDTTLLKAADLLPTSARPFVHVHLCYVSNTPDATETSEEEPVPVPSVGASSRSGLGDGNTLRNRRTGETIDHRPTQPAPPPRPPPPPVVPPANAEPALDSRGETPVCRLCFDDEETPETGPLFSPCLCTGSMRFIHVDCLNKWRCRSQNQSSYYRCDQCRYQYNVERARWATYLLDKRVSAVAAGVCLVLATLLLGVCTWFLDSGPLYEKIWRNISLSPLEYVAQKSCTAWSEASSGECNTICNSWSWNWKTACFNAGCRCSLVVEPFRDAATKILTNGIALVALCGLIVHLPALFENWQRGLILVASFFGAPAGYTRFYLILGSIHAYYILQTLAEGRMRRIMTQFGERILSVHG
ncbi:hypothetical protein DIPPA_19047 [Diplonema papillatum]|nr:hypothetical protein DIPPA_19047 [Diplonema papillatum]